jgi:DNA-binding phage protein
MPSPSKYLATYLNDHVLGATLGTELARRAARENQGSDLGEFLTGLARDIDDDRDTLLAVMRELGVKLDRLKVAAGWTGEKLGRLKPNAQLRGYSPLSPLVELEGLLIGIQGKLAMWQVLAEVAQDVGLDRERLEALSARAERQQADVERHRLDVGRRALTAH